MSLTETITLSITPQRHLMGVATLVAGGLGGRLQLPVDRIDDLQLALTTLLRREDEGARLTIEFAHGDGAITARIGPVHDASVETVLNTVARLVSSAEREDRVGDTWVVLRLATPTPAANGRG